MRLWPALHALWALLFCFGLLCAAPAAHAQNQARGSAQPLNSSTSNASIIVDLMDNQTAATFYVSGLTASGATLTIEGSSDGRGDADSLKTWVAINALPLSCPATPFSTLTVDQGFKVDVTGLTNIRVRVSSTGNGKNILVSFNAISGAFINAASCGGGAVNPSTIYSGQQTLTTSAVALPSQALSNGIVITSKSTNTGTVYVGPSGVTSSTGYILIAGQSVSYAVGNLSSIYIIGTNGTDVVTFTGN